MSSRLDVVSVCLAMQRRPMFRPVGYLSSTSITVDAISNWQKQTNCGLRRWAEDGRLGWTRGWGSRRPARPMFVWVASILYVPSQSKRAANSKASEVAGIYHVQEMDGAGLGGLIDPSSRVLHPLSMCLHTSWT